MEVLTTFKTITHVEIAIKSARVGFLWENDSHMRLKEDLRRHKLGVPFSRITLNLREQIPRRMAGGQLPFWAYYDYSYDSKGKETAVIRSST